jgi:hypothetical protein
LKSFRLKDEPPSDEPPDDPGNPTVNFRGEPRSNATHQSTTDAEARLARKGRGKEAHLAYSAHALMENRHGVLVDFLITQATGTAETRHVGYAVSQRKRPLVEEIFGWMKTVGGFRRTRFIGLERTQLAGYFVSAAYNLVRIARLMQAAAVA